MGIRALAALSVLGSGAAFGLLGGAAILVKGTAVFFIAGAWAGIGLLLAAPGLRRSLRSPQVWAMALLAVLPYAAYMIWGVLLDGSLQGQFSLRFFPQYWVDPVFYLRWYNLLDGALGLPWLALGLLGALFLPGRAARGLVWGGWLAYLGMGLALSHHVSTHDYYSLPLVPLLGLGLAALAEVVFQAVPQPRRLTAVLVGVVLLAAAGMSAWNARTALKRADYRAEPAFWAGLAGKMGLDAGVVGITQDYGARMVYYGWVNPANWLTSAEFDLRRSAGQSFDLPALFADLTQGKQFFLVTMPEELDLQPELKALLEERYPVFAEGDGYIIYDLRSPLPGRAHNGLCQRANLPPSTNPPPCWARLIFLAGLAVFAFAGSYARYWSDDYCYSYFARDNSLPASLWNWYVNSGNRFSTLLPVTHRRMVRTARDPFLPRACAGGLGGGVGLLPRAPGRRDWLAGFAPLAGIARAGAGLFLRPAGPRPPAGSLLAHGRPALHISAGAAAGQPGLVGRALEAGLRSLVCAGQRAAGILRRRLLGDLRRFPDRGLRPAPARRLADRRAPSRWPRLRPPAGQAGRCSARCLGMAALALAPSNAMRQAVLPPPDNLLDVVTYSLRYAADFTWYSLRGQPLPTLVFMALVALTAFLAAGSAAPRLSLRRAVTAIAVSLAAGYILVVCCMAPSTYGALLYPPGRALMVARFALLLSLGSAALICRAGGPRVDP